MEHDYSTRNSIEVNINVDCISENHMEIDEADISRINDLSESKFLLKRRVNGAEFDKSKLQEDVAETATVENSSNDETVRRKFYWQS